MTAPQLDRRPPAQACDPAPTRTDLTLLPGGRAGTASRPTRRAVLGDSTAVGIGDPVPGGGWRGFPILLRDALGGAELTNLARAGARMADVRAAQLPAALAGRPDVAVVCAGMNDTLRSDFDAAGIGADCAATADALTAAGAHVLLLRYHDHTRVFRLPGPLQRALRARIDALNAALDVAADRPGVSVLDLDRMPGGYEPAAWSVDRLHPSERGHRLVADGLASLLAGTGHEVPATVALTCAGGRQVTAAHHAAWLLVKGVPWLVRRGRDLGPVIATGMVAGLRRA